MKKQRPWVYVTYKSILAGRIPLLVLQTSCTNMKSVALSKTEKLWLMRGNQMMGMVQCDRVLTRITFPLQNTQNIHSTACPSKVQSKTTIFFLCGDREATLKNMGQCSYVFTNSLWPSNAIWHHITWIGNGLIPVLSKPLSEPIH